MTTQLHFWGRIYSHGHDFSSPGRTPVSNQTQQYTYLHTLLYSYAYAYGTTKQTFGSLKNHKQTSTLNSSLKRNKYHLWRLAQKHTYTADTALA